MQIFITEESPGWRKQMSRGNIEQAARSQPRPAARFGLFAFRNSSAGSGYGSGRGRGRLIVESGRDIADADHPDQGMLIEHGHVPDVVPVHQVTDVLEAVVGAA